MNAVVQPVLEDDDSLPAPGPWEMKQLKPWHKQLCNMLAQGIDRETIATVLDCTPQYVTMLAGQPMVQRYIREMCQFANLQLEAQFAEGVKIVGEVMRQGNHKDKLQAVRLNAELTHRIGSGALASPENVDTNERLARLAEKLLALQEKMQPASTLPVIDGEFHEAQQAETDSSPAAVGTPG